MTNSEYGQSMLTSAREQAKQLGIKLPTKLSVTVDKAGMNPYREVWCDDGYIVWSGVAFSSAEAKAEYFFQIIEDSGNTVSRDED